MSSSFRIHRWSTSGIGSVNTYWLETDTSAIVIDGQRELSKASEVLADIDATGKPIVAVFLTHPHPDHFGGLSVFAPSRSVPLYASRRTRDSIAQDRYGLVKASREILKDDFPAEVTLPTHELADGQELVVDGVRFIAHELGEGEAECMTVLHVPQERALFCGDIIQHQMTAFLLEGRLARWIEQIPRLQAMFPDVERYYPGHGEPGPAALLAERQIEYLRTFGNLVAVETHGDDIEPAQEQRIIDAMEAQYPGFLPVAAIPDLLRRNVAPVARELHAGDAGKR